MFLRLSHVSVNSVILFLGIIRIFRLLGAVCWPVFVLMSFFNSIYTVINHIRILLEREILQSLHGAAVDQWYRAGLQSTRS
jgi:hypothetical protein